MRFLSFSGVTATRCFTASLVLRTMLKRPSAHVDVAPAANASETGAAAKRPRLLKPSDYCKNTKCAGPNGSRLRKQSGCQGYCRKCAALFVPDVMAAVKSKMKDADKKRADKFPCSRCGATYYFKMDPDTKLHYCKACWPKRPSGEPSVLRCEFCFATGSGVTSRVCSTTEICSRRAIMCDFRFDLRHDFREDFREDCEIDCEIPEI